MKFENSKEKIIELQKTMENSEKNIKSAEKYLKIAEKY